MAHAADKANGFSGLPFHVGRTIGSWRQFVADGRVVFVRELDEPDATHESLERSGGVMSGCQTPPNVAGVGLKGLVTVPVDDRDRGYYQKFLVERLDGSSGKGGKHEGCEYFVLDLNHDEYAIPALEAYAQRCFPAYSKLARDLWAKVDAMRVRFGLRKMSADDACDVIAAARLPSSVTEEIHLQALRREEEGRDADA
jgi:hypothetical protein